MCISVTFVYPLACTKIGKVPTSTESDRFSHAQQRVKETGQPKPLSHNCVIDPRGCFAALRFLLIGLPDPTAIAPAAVLQLEATSNASTPTVGSAHSLSASTRRLWFVKARRVLAARALCRAASRRCRVVAASRACARSSRDRCWHRSRTSAAVGLLLLLKTNSSLW